VLPEKWITDENRVVVVTGPEKEESPLPTEEDVLQILTKVDQMDMQAYEDKVSEEPLLATELKPVAISNEKTYESVGVTEYTLANGVKVVLKPTTFKNDEIQMRAMSDGGHSLYGDEDYVNASNASSIVNEAGVAQFDNTMLSKMLTGKRVSVFPYIGELSEGVNGGASPDDLQTMFELIYLYFTAPRKDEQALQSYVAKQKSIYKNLMSNPQYWFMNEVSKIKYQNHMRRGFPKAEDLDKIDLDRAYEIYKERFADASDFTFIFVGNIDVEKMKEMTAKYLGNLPSTNRQEKWKNINADFPKGVIVKELIRGKAPKSLIEIDFHGDFDYSDEQGRYNFYSLMDLMRIKMRESMREDKGGVYGVRVSGRASQYPEEKYTITISFNSEPDKAEELIQTAMQDIKNAKEKGAEEKDLTKVKETQKQSRIKDLKENRFWLGQLSTTYQNGLDPSRIGLEELEKLMKGLDSEAIKSAANQYFDTENMIKIVMNPEPEMEN
ncbi:MAG: insulinase family protein, partial [Bacteroidota bacterium]